MLADIFYSQSESWKKTFYRVIIFSTFFHLLAAIFSEGFHRPDEHLGIMRFVGYKLGMLTAEQAHVSWEWEARIRPWLQPGIYIALLTPLKALGLENPFTMATILRLFNALIGELSLIVLFLLSAKFLESEKIKKITLYALALLWYVPFFHARGTSEHFAMSFFIFGLPFFLGKRKIIDSMLVGFFFACSFIFRYQMCVPIFFLCLWQIFQKEKQLKHLFLITLSFFAFNGLAAIVDFWGYQEWVFPPYQYLYWNIVEGKASSFGVDPWWKYFEKVITRGVPPISLVLFLPVIWFWIKRPMHILTWISLPFFIVHSMIGHKEIRFLFGIGLLSPIILGIFLEQKEKFSEYVRFGKFLCFLSIILMTYSSLKVAYTPITFYKDLYNSGKTPNKIYTSDVIRDPMYFYMRKPFDFKLLKAEEFRERMEIESGYYFSNNHEIQGLLAKSCERIHQTYPEWILKNKPKFVTMKYWGLYFCSGLEKASSDSK